MISAVGIISVSLDLLGRDEYVLPVFPSPRIDLAVDVLDLGRVAIRIVAATERWIVRHLPCRVELLVQELILWGMVVRGLA